MNQNSPKGQGKNKCEQQIKKQIHTVNELGYSFQFYSRENNICRKNRPVSRLPLNIMQEVECLTANTPDARLKHSHFSLPP